MPVMSISAVLSKIAAIRLLQSDCMAKGFDVKNKVYGEQSTKIPIPS